MDIEVQAAVGTGEGDIEAPDVNGRAGVTAISPEVDLESVILRELEHLRTRPNVGDGIGSIAGGEQRSVEGGDDFALDRLRGAGGECAVDSDPVDQWRRLIRECDGRVSVASGNSIAQLNVERAVGSGHRRSRAEG